MKTKKHTYKIYAINPKNYTWTKQIRWKTATSYPILYYTESGWEDRKPLLTDRTFTHAPYYLKRTLSQATLKSYKAVEITALGFEATLTADSYSDLNKKENDMFRKAENWMKHNGFESWFEANPDYVPKPKKAKRVATGKDVAGQIVKVGDKIAFAWAKSVKLHVDEVIDITERSFITVQKTVPQNQACKVGV